jgi:hypothetical protein
MSAESIISLMIVRWQGWGPSMPWNADIMMLPLTAAGCAVCTHGRAILIDSLHHELYCSLGAVWVYNTVQRKEWVFLYTFVCLHLQPYAG